ncbi:MAG: SGNH/GDSL hydrolase family protein [Bacillota bacterium]
MSKLRIEDMDTNFAASKIVEDGVLWRDARASEFRIKGLHWLTENIGALYRLPIRAENIVRPPVWELAKAPASAYVEFSTDSTKIAVKAVTIDGYDLPNMTPCGCRGLALYHRGAFGRWHPCGTAMPQFGCPEYQSTLVEELVKERRDYRLYLPLYKELTSLLIGIDEDALVFAPQDKQTKPIVFYGTSITQGGCASTAGTDYVSIIGRELNSDVINLGFSGNGMGEPEVAQLTAEIDAALFVLDYNANVNVEQLHQTLPIFTDILREKYPATPIVYVTPTFHGKITLQETVARYYEDKRDIMVAEYIRRRNLHDQNIHLVDGYALCDYGSDSALVDCVHPTDYGFRIFANRLMPYLEMILDRAARQDRIR